MDGMDRIRKDIKEYCEKKGKKHEKILISEKFYNQLHKESIQKDPYGSIVNVRSTIIDFPGMKIVKDVDYDFRLLP
jgi:hypothetical protein